SQNSKVRDLGSLPGYPNCDPIGINDAGEIVGSAFSDGGLEHPFLWRSGQMTALPAPTRALQSGALAINNHGLIVGWSGGVGEAFQRATLWAGGKVYDLNDLALPGAHGTLGSARAINDRGQIIVNSMDKDGRHAYLLTPVRIKSNATPSLPSLPQSLHIVYSMTQTYTSDKSTWTIPAELWLAAPNCARWTIYGKFTESRLTDGAQWTALSIDSAHPDKPILRTEPANSWRNDETSAYGPGVIAGEIPFLGFRQPGKVYRSKESRVVKTPTGWQEHCRVPHGYARLEGSGKPALVDALLTYDRQGRLVRFQRDLRSPGTYFEHYDYGDFAKIGNGADIPRLVTFSQQFRDAPDKPAVTEYQTVYRVKSVETKPIPPEMFTGKNPTPAFGHPSP
ncbi:MAG: hypothetical protein M3Y13_08945, partial [Armatimonadota bacterium]|nr:hypothetical protein [Armatimonadota bacterium]